MGKIKTLFIIMFGMLSLTTSYVAKAGNLTLDREKDLFCSIKTSRDGLAIIVRVENIGTINEHLNLFVNGLDLAHRVPLFNSVSRSYVIDLGTLGHEGFSYKNIEVYGAGVSLKAKVELDLNDNAERSIAGRLVLNDEVRNYLTKEFSKGVIKSDGWKTVLKTTSLFRLNCR